MNERWRLTERHKFLRDQAQLEDLAFEARAASGATKIYNTTANQKAEVIALRAFRDFSAEFTKRWAPAAASPKEI